MTPSALTRRGFIGRLLGGAAAAVAAPRLLIPDRELITNKSTFVYGSGVRRAAAAPYSIPVFITETNQAITTWTVGTGADAWRFPFEEIPVTQKPPPNAHWFLNYPHATNQDLAADLSTRRDAPVPWRWASLGTARPRGDEDPRGDHQANG